MNLVRFVEHAAARLDPTGRRMTFALGISLLLHGLVLGLNFRGFDLAFQKHFSPSLTVVLTDLKSPPSSARSELAGEIRLQGGGNADAPGHAESPSAATDEEQPAPNEQFSAVARPMTGEFQNLPTERRFLDQGQRAAEKGDRQSRSDSAAGPHRRGGDDCWVLGFRFCSS